MQIVHMNTALHYFPKKNNYLHQKDVSRVDEVAVDDERVDEIGVHEMGSRRSGMTSAFPNLITEITSVPRVHSRVVSVVIFFFFW